jgi:hypothetical protein
VKMDDFIFWFIFRCGKGSWTLSETVTDSVNK